MTPSKNKAAVNSFCRTLLILFLTMTTPLVWAYHVYTDDSGIYTESWPQGTIPMVIKMPTSPNLIDVTSFASSVQTAMKKWNAQLGAVQFTSQVVTTPMNPPAGTYSSSDTDTINEIVMDSAYDGSAFDAQTLAITLSFTRGNAIVKSDIVFNTAFQWDSYRGGKNGAFQDIQRVAIHELGHVLGLDHPDETDPSHPVTAIMNTHVSYSPAIDTMQPDDIAGAQLLYGAPGFVPPNDNFANAILIPLSNGSIQLTGTNIGASRQSGEPNHAGANASGHSVWWKWTAPSTASMTITTLGSNFDTVLAVYNGNSVSTLSPPVAINDDVTNGAIRTSAVTFNAINGTTYYVAVDGWGSTSRGQAYTYTGAITLNANFVVIPDSPPFFTVQPVSSDTLGGGTAFFSVAVSGQPPPGLQWQRLPAGNSTWINLTNGGNYSGVTTSTLSLANTTFSMTGDMFRCVATNSSGSQASTAATLTVNLPPLLTTIPLSQSVASGGSITLTAVSTGSPAPTFQWKFNGAIIAGATGTSYTIPRVSIANAGNYTLVATNVTGSITSLVATLTVVLAQPAFFDGDSKADALWRNTSTGLVSSWTSGGGFVTFGTEGGGWSVITVGDFDGDGHSEPLWHNSVTGIVAAWTSSLGYRVYGVESGGWYVLGTGDFDHDGKDDVLWHNTSSGVVASWTSTSGYQIYGYEGGGWSVIAAADFNGDGKADLVWHNVITGAASAVLTGGGGISLGTEGGGWEIIGVGDFNADGKADVIWHNTSSGVVTVVLTDGGGLSLGTEGGGWQVIGAGDFNGDGKADALWHNTSTGTVTVVLTGGGGLTLGTEGDGWTVIH